MGIGLSRTISDYLGLFCSNIELSRTISNYLGLSRTISDYLGLFRTISDYLRLSRTISGYHYHRPGNNSCLSGSGSQCFKTFCPKMSKIVKKWSNQQIISASSDNFWQQGCQAAPLFPRLLLRG